MRIVRKETTEEEKIEEQNQLNPFSKFDHVLDILNRSEGQVVIFSQYMMTLHKLSRFLTGKVKHGILNGNVSKRKSVLHKYRNKESRALLLSLKSNGSGLDLNCTKHIIFMETCANTSLMKQAIGRAVRIGNPYPKIHVHHIFFGDTVEEGVMVMWNMRHTSECKVLIKDLETKTFSETLSDTFLTRNNGIFTKELTDLIVIRNT
tara:strand:- start:5 stop:619 length:615 start_codon:yes stop_codon:yes gene_type:complete